MIDPYQILGIDSETATDESVRKAYLIATRKHPPDRDPKNFERIRHAYNMIQTEIKRIELDLFGVDYIKTHMDWQPEEQERPRAKMSQWLNAIEEESKRMPNPHSNERKST